MADSDIKYTNMGSRLKQECYAIAEVVTTADRLNCGVAIFRKEDTGVSQIVIDTRIPYGEVHMYPYGAKQEDFQ